MSRTGLFRQTRGRRSASASTAAWRVFGRPMRRGRSTGTWRSRSRHPVHVERRRWRRRFNHWHRSRLAWWQHWCRLGEWPCTPYERSYPRRLTCRSLHTSLTRRRPVSRHPAVNRWSACRRFWRAVRRFRWGLTTFCTHRSRASCRETLARRGARATALRWPGHRGDHLAVGITHACREPLPNQSPPRAVLQAVLHHPAQPGGRAVGAHPLAVRFDHQGGRPTLARDRQLRPGGQRPNLGPSPIATAPDVRRVDRFEARRDCPLPQRGFPGG